MHLGASNVFSGGENVITQIMGVFSKNDISVSMVYCTPKGPISNSLRERNINFYEIKRFSLLNIAKAIKAIKPDVIHAHDLRSSVFAALLGCKVRVVSHIHANHECMKKVTIKSVLFLLFSIRFKHIFWVSQSSLGHYVFKRRIDKKSSVLSNIIDVEEVNRRLKLDVNTYNFDIVFIGRLTYQKNPQRLIHIASKLKKKIPWFKMAIVGNGELFDILAQLVRSNNLESNVFLLGYMTNPLKLLESSKLLVLVSRYEGTPMCAIEAMILGVPIVSTKTDGLVDLVSDTETGFLSDDNDDLVDNLVNIITNESLRAKMGIKSKEKISSMMDPLAYYQIISKAYNTR